MGYLREWEPKRSKIAAAILKNLDQLPFRKNTNVLYLGAASGTTVSHLSDICSEGRIYAIEKAYDPFVKLLDLAEHRDNIFPIIEDATMVSRFDFFVDHVEVIYQDIAQRNQVQIFNENAAAFPEAKEALLVLKLRAITSRGRIQDVLKIEIAKISGFREIQSIEQSPKSKANYMLHLRIHY